MTLTAAERLIGPAGVWRFLWVISGVPATRSEPTWSAIDHPRIQPRSTSRTAQQRTFPPAAARLVLTALGFQGAAAGRTAGTTIFQVLVLSSLALLAVCASIRFQRARWKGAAATEPSLV